MIADPNYSPKNTARTVVKSTNRNSTRRDIMANYQNHIFTLDRPFHPQNNTSTVLQKNENSQSTVLKRVKIGSMRTGNENGCSLKLNKINDSVDSNHQKHEQIPKKEAKYNHETKERSVKSFMIRKKNISSYNKKREEDSSKCEIQLQDLHKIVMLEIDNNSKEIDKRVYGEFSNQDIKKIDPSITRQKGNKPVSVHALQNSFNYDKGQQTAKRIPKKIGKYFNQSTENNNVPVPSIQKRQANSSFKCIESALNKMRVISNASVKECPSQCRSNVQEKAQKKQKINAQQLKQQKQNKQQRSKVHAVCKTIKVPWQVQAVPFSDIQNKLTKKCDNSNKPGTKQDFFGGISMIPHQDKKEWISRKESVPAQSLQEIFLELQIVQAQSISLLKTSQLLNL